MSEQDGGPAFPLPGWEGFTGMSIRDYFAAAALTGLIANESAASLDMTDAYDNDARRCYQMADAMLRARRPA